MDISIITVITQNGQIYSYTPPPWHLPDYEAYFHRLTDNHTLLVDRHVYQALRQQLSDHPIIILSRKTKPHFPGCDTVGELEEAFALAEKSKETELFIAGGRRLFYLAMPFANRLYITRVHSILPGDRPFPFLNQFHWSLINRYFHPKDQNHSSSYTLDSYERR